VARKTRSKGFNEYVRRSVEMIARDRAGLGYNINSYFTRDLKYGRKQKAIRANHPPLTMCVAAVSEVIIEALNIYAEETGDYTPFQKLPARSWNGGSVTDIRPYMFMYDSVKSNGTADALTKFGIGRRMSFEELLPGDFINLNRASGSGHATVFLGFINMNYGDETTYSNRVVGFKYFSSQGKPNPGFGYRWAFFEGNNPAAVPGKPWDRHIEFSHNQSILNCGHMYTPSDWTTKSAIEDIRSAYLEKRFKDLVGRHMNRNDHTAIVSNSGMAKFARGLLDSELETVWDPSRFDGITD
jgi:hypothetical protein